ncbi:hypothetical protein ACNQGX_18205, partial [Flavobacterium sp. ZB4P13]
MKNITYKKISLLLFFLALFFVANPIRAQFPFSQSFRNSTAPGIQFGGAPAAFLTGGAGAIAGGYNDSNGSGYLRLTNASGNQKGFIWSDANAFPSSYGMNISFEYYTYGGDGADGIAFVLFDALVSNPTPGAFGGSLGYAQKSAENGFQGGYLGVGIDEFGNFSNGTEGRNGGVGSKPSNVTLRGKGNGTTGATQYPYLTSVQTTVLASSFNVAGGSRVATTTASAGFRKVEIILRPNAGVGFFIDVYLTHGATRDLIISNYSYATLPPANLKFAITSSTGGSNNFHEIRNLDITVDPSTLLTPVANPDSFSECVGLPAISADITANDNGAVNTLGTVNKAAVDLDTSTAGIQTSNTVAGQGTFTYDSGTGKVTFTPINNTIVGPVAINYTFNDSYGKTSNSSTITYTAYTPIATNTIAAPSPSTFCFSGDAGNIVGSTATGGTTALTYQWESSTDNVTFNYISGATSKDYDPASITATTYYRRVVSSGTCNNDSNVVAIQIDPSPTLNITSATPICSGNNAVFNLTGTPNAVVTYNINGGSAQTVTLDATGKATVTVSSVVANTTLNATSISSFVAPITGNAISASGLGSDVNNTVGAILTAGSSAVAATSALLNNTYSSVTLTLGATVPAGTPIIVSLARNNNTGAGSITSGGATTTVPNTLGTVDTLTRLTVTPTSATNTVVISRTAGRLYIDGVEYTFTPSTCNVTLTLSNTVVVNPTPTLTGAAQAASVCVGSGATINLTGLLASSTSTVAYTING